MKPANQLFHLNRPPSPLSQPASQQHAGSFSLGFIYPHPFSQQHSAVRDESTLRRKVPGTDNLKPNGHQLSGGAFGHHWDFARSDVQYAEYSQSSPAILVNSGPVESLPLPDVPCTSHSVPTSSSRPYQSPDIRLNAWIPNSNSNQQSAPLSHSPSSGQSSAFAVNRSNCQPLLGPDKRKVSDFPPNNSPSEDDDRSYLDDHALAWGAGEASTGSSRGIQTDAASEAEVQRPAEQPKTKRWKRKLTERRREQNRIHQRAFRERNKLSLKQKDALISKLKDRLERHQEAIGQQSERIRSLKARISLYVPLKEEI
ncbi:hypothetical protein PTTG_26576 [Puccinia triticina 1-1 BBBD Race 1]|uniref:BZIP domain-containing protein n=1 Tax=Puccinia triticina (isolate 1-1 / race 1 (BBBD)) TaxID=630390 RepID=A0A180GSN9_PUCT1|nr:hypothetical protein PTTG_26576 [Puccinia triticina 1-1 BBBD Race 1]